MDLIDRYAKAVAKALPQDQREDIVGELSEDIRSEIEDREKELGRQLTNDEQESLLKQRGNPLIVAARYRQDHRTVSFGRQFIGPVLYPFYIKVLSFNLGLTFLVIAIIFTALAVSGQKLGFHDIVSTSLLQLFIQLVVVTIIFSVVETHLKTHPDSWHLKATGGGLALDLKTKKDAKLRVTGAMIGRRPEVSRFESVSIIVASIVAIVWLTAVQNNQFLILGPAVAFLKLAPIWHRIYFPIVLLTVAEIVRAVINLVRPDWTRFRAIWRLVVQAGGLAIVYFLVKAGNWVAVADAVANRASDYARAVVIVNECFYYALLATAILSAAMLILRIVGFIKRRRWQGGSHRVGSAAQERN
ncbi:MAG TPA: hypothetical protein VMI32_07425 [Candidatus Solibacter sp.]|nr:hypothetical protein [Candidatus Solibacter sp.]